MDMEPLRHNAFYSMEDSYKLDAALRPLTALVAMVPLASVSRVFEFVVHGRAAMNGVSWQVHHAVPVTEPLKRKQKGRKAYTELDPRTNQRNLGPHKEG